jgi:DNA-binding Xre family transcriptional regulator
VLEAPTIPVFVFNTLNQTGARIVPLKLWLVDRSSVLVVGTLSVHFSRDLYLDNLQLLGANIRKYRNARKWSIETLAEHANMDPSYLGEIERGRENITIRTLDRIAKALGVKASVLLETE